LPLSVSGSTFTFMSKRVAIHRGIRAIRLAKGISQGAAATSAFISSVHLNNIEAGRRPATPELIPLLAAALDCELDAISYVAESENAHA
jgi:transcriptional regulator with XRE-family HTH domain